MIPSRRLVLIGAIPVGLALAWVVVPALLPVIAALDGLIAAVALIDALRSGGSVSLRREHGPVASVGVRFEVALVVRNTTRRRLELVVADDAPCAVDGLPITLRLDAGQAVRVSYGLTPSRRGRYVFGPITARWSSPFGLWSRQVRAPGASGEDAFRVYPDFSYLRQDVLRGRQDERRMPVRARRRPGGESEFERLRNYVPGDPYRHIDWKATARRQKFVSREYGQEVNQNVVFLLDAGRTMGASLGGLTAFDVALNAALAMGHAALRRGDRVGFLVFDREVRAWMPPRGGSRSGARLLQGTYDVFPSMHEPDYAGAFRHLTGAVRRRSLVVLMTTAHDQVNADAASAVVGALAGRHLPLCVWLRDPTLDALTDGGGEASPYVRAAAGELTRWREAALASWRQRGALVVDCAPDLLSARLLDSYLEVKARRLL